MPNTKTEQPQFPARLPNGWNLISAWGDESIPDIATELRTFDRDATILAARRLREEINRSTVTDENGTTVVPQENERPRFPLLDCQRRFLEMNAPSGWERIPMDFSAVERRVLDQQTATYSAATMEQTRRAEERAQQRERHRAENLRREQENITRFVQQQLRQCTEPIDSTTHADLQRAINLQFPFSDIRVTGMTSDRSAIRVGITVNNISIGIAEPRTPPRPTPPPRVLETESQRLVRISGIVRHILQNHYGELDTQETRNLIAREIQQRVRIDEGSRNVYFRDEPIETLTPIIDTYSNLYLSGLIVNHVDGPPETPAYVAISQPPVAPEQQNAFNHYMHRSVIIEPVNLDIATFAVCGACGEFPLMGSNDNKLEMIANHRKSGPHKNAMARQRRRIRTQA